MTDATTPLPQLILLPGLLNDAELWRDQIEGLADVARIWVPDLAPYATLREMAESVLAKAEPTFALAGFSMGGYVAQEIVRIAPGRVSRLALLDTRSRPEEPAETQRRHEFIKLAQTERGFTPVTTRLLPLLMHPSRVKEAALVDVIRDMAERTGVEAYVRQQTAIIGRPDFRPHLAKISCPTLVLCGRQDALTPLADSESIAASIPGAKLVVVEACGHMSTMERPKEVNAALRNWLEA